MLISQMLEEEIGAYPIYYKIYLSNTDQLCFDVNYWESVKERVETALENPEKYPFVTLKVENKEYTLRTEHIVVTEFDPEGNL